jgi:dihydropteroate synthase
MINDISALRVDPRLAEVVADSGAGVVLMHMQGTPQTMQVQPHYDDVIGEIKEFFTDRLHAAARAGIPEDHIVLDPGIGFGKRLEDNLTLLAQLDALLVLGRPLLVGVSRKGFIGQILDRPVGERLMGTVAASVMAILRGARIIRVHDVAAMRDAVRMLESIRSREKP